MIPGRPGGRRPFQPVRSGAAGLAALLLLPGRTQHVDVKSPLHTVSFWRVEMCAQALPRSVPGPWRAENGLME